MSTLDEIMASMEAQIRRIERLKRTLIVHPDDLTPQMRAMAEDCFHIKVEPLQARGQVYILPSADERERFGGFEPEVIE